MFRFENPIFLYLLVLIPVLALIRFIAYQRQRKRLKAFGELKLIKALMPDVSRFRPWVKYLLSLAALAMLVVMLARPQMGTKVSEEKRNGIETMIAIDISNSMRAEDVVPSRIDKSKMLIENLVDNFTNDKVGVIVFAGDAFIQLPITSDFVSAKMFMQNIDPSLIASQGTNIGEAIRIASNSFTSLNARRYSYLWLSSVHSLVRLWARLAVAASSRCSSSTTAAGAIGSGLALPKLAKSKTSS